MMKIALFALLVEIAAARIPASLLLPEMHPGCQCLLDELNIGNGEAECPVEGWECNVDGDSFEIHYKGSLARKQLESKCGVMSNHNRYGVRGVLRCPPPSCPEFAEFTFERSGAWNFECEKPGQQF